jgi:hypothetical protein
LKGIYWLPIDALSLLKTSFEFITAQFNNHQAVLSWLAVGLNGSSAFSLHCSRSASVERPKFECSVQVAPLIDKRAYFLDEN